MWRGLLDEQMVSDIAPYEGGEYLCRFHLWAISSLTWCRASRARRSQPRDGSTGAGMSTRLKPTWRNRSPTATGRTHPTSLPAGSISDERANELRELAREFMPRFVADAIARTERPFIQAIFDLHAPDYRRGNILLLGDASSVVRPHAAAGRHKGAVQRDRPGRIPKIAAVFGRGFDALE